MGARAGSGPHRTVRRHPDREPLGQGAHVRVPDRVGREAERAARARDGVEGRRQQDDRLHAAAWSEVPQRQGGHGCGLQVLVRPAAEPAGAGQRRRAGPGAGDRGYRGAEQVRPADEAEEPGRAGVRLPRLEPLLGDRARGHVRPGQRRTRGDRHGAVPAARVPAQQPRRVRPLPELLEEGPALPRRSVVQDPGRRAGTGGCSAGRCDRRRHVLGRQCEGARSEPQPEGAAGPDGRVPRAADDDQAGRPQAVARHPRAAGGQLRDQPPGDHQQGLQRVRRVQRARPPGLRPVAAHPFGAA